jgi:putative membrane protein
VTYAREMPFQTEGFAGAIAAIERASSAEVVVTVQPRVRRWLAAHVIAGALVMTAVLAFMLFSEDYEFELWSFTVAPLLAAILGGVIVEATPLERVMTPRSVRTALVREAATAAFYDHGVHGTSGRTGVLVFVALRERVVQLVGDLEVVKQLSEEARTRQMALLAAELPDGPRLASKLASFAPEYAAALPVTVEDRNELGDHVHHRRPLRSFRGHLR